MAVLDCVDLQERKSLTQNNAPGLHTSEGECSFTNELRPVLALLLLQGWDGGKLRFLTPPHSCYPGARVKWVVRSQP